ncbi:MAG: hypothetical protein JNK04_11485 [Myxococcales bacterium]|nr:hypothetical protein [Myxococcales bacterium]
MKSSMDNQANPGTGDVQQGGAGVELARLLVIIKRAFLNWKPSAFLVAIGLIGGVAFAVVRKPSFKSETIVIYRQGVKLNQEGGAGASLALGTRLQEMLLARSRLEPILTELELYPEIRAKQGDIQAVEEFRKDITFKARSTDTFSISYKGLNPEMVQRVTDRLSLSLIEENQRLRVEQSRVQREFLEQEKTNAEGLLKQKEKGLAQFLNDHPEFALDQNASAMGAAFRAKEKESERLRSPNGQNAAIDALRRQSARIDSALTGETAVNTFDVPADPDLEAARSAAQSRLQSAKSDLSTKQASFQDKHPDVIAAKARVAEAEAALKAADDKVAANKLQKAGANTTDPAVAKQKLKDKKRKIDAEIAAREKLDDKDKQPDSGSEEVVSIVSLETEWSRLSRDVSESRDRMNQLERDTFRAQIDAASSLGGYSDQVVVLDPAFMPTRPEPPGKTLIVVLAGGAAFVLGLILAFLRALLDSRIFEESDISRIAPVLAVVPKGGSRRWWRR